MEPRHLITAATLVVGALALLALWPADGPVDPAPDRPRPTDRVVELAPPGDEPPIATVELDAAELAEQPGGADTQIVRRFAHERRNPAWAEAAAARVTARATPAIAPFGGTVADIECRQSACRLRVSFDDAARRPDGVAALLAAFAENGDGALLESVAGRDAVLIVEP